MSEKLISKCNEIIDSLDNFTIIEKYKVIKELYDSFFETCKMQGINILELVDKEKKA